MQYNVLAATELSECDCRTVEIADQKILVARVGGRCHAIGAICPHAGAPLGEGVRRDGIIICPWQISPLSRSTAKARESAWSKRLDYVGHAKRWDDVVIDGDLQVPNFVAFYVRGGIVQAVAGWGRDQQMAAIIPLLTNRQDWSVTGLREAMLPAPQVILRVFLRAF